MWHWRPAAAGQSSAASPYGMTGQVLVFAREGVLPSTIKDMAARAIAGSGTEYLVEDGGSSGNL